jgi:hypothetical protein
MDNTHWWLPWLPLVGSMIVSATAVVGVMINNKTSQAAIRSARVIDHHKWLRETLLQLGSHAAGHAFEIDRLYNARSFATNDDVFTHGGQLKPDRISRARRHLHGNPARGRPSGRTRQHPPRNHTILGTCATRSTDPRGRRRPTGSTGRGTETIRGPCPVDTESPRPATGRRHLTATATG